MHQVSSYCGSAGERAGCQVGRCGAARSLHGRDSEFSGNDPDLADLFLVNFITLQFGSGGREEEREKWGASFNCHSVYPRV